MARHLFKWYTFNVFFGFLPTVISSLLRLFSQKFNTYDNSLEILFLSLLICIASLYDVSEIKSKAKYLLNALFIDILYYWFVLLVVLILVVYTYRTVEIMSGTLLTTELNVFFTFIICIGVVCVLFGTLVQVIIYRIGRGVK